jgi:2-methylcitrate dehydratase PrpD
MTTTTTYSLLKAVIGQTAGINYADVDATTRAYLQIALLDWTGVTVAGAHEESSAIVRRVLGAEGGRAQATALGSHQLLSARQAALANGVAGHALDYDDMGLGGAHPSTVVVPAVLAVAEREGASGERLAQGLLAGYQTLALVSYAAGWSAYRRGFHTTGTVGTIAAAAGCARLLDLDESQWVKAIGLAATQAAGLKASFGTMAKHLNAGQAAANGVLAADLAAAGFTAADDGLQDPQGFLSTHGDLDDVDFSRAANALGADNAVRHLMFKIHASCGGTHSSIESVAAAMRDQDVVPETVERVELTVSSDLIAMCGIPNPRTGLEGKFSLRHTAALALLGLSTGPAGFTDEAVLDVQAADMRSRITIIPSDQLAVDGPAEAIVILRDGTRVAASVNPYRPLPVDGLADATAVLADKFRQLVTPVLGPERTARAEDLVARFDRLGSVADLVGALRTDPAAR